METSPIPHARDEVAAPPIRFPLRSLEVQHDEAALPAQSWARRWAGAAVIVYFALYTLPFPLSLLPYTGDGQLLGWVGQVQQYLGAGSEAVTTWFGAQVLQLDNFAPPASTGSGDTLHSYVHAAALAATAAVVGLLFALLDRRGALLRWSSGCLRLQLRYVLAMAMLGYGFDKVMPLQFGRMEGDALYWTYGNASPMNLLWCFLSASPAYTVFSGAMEVSSGLLLFWRRTTLLGALLGIAVMSNVAMLNFCYDVPVKLYSLHLLAMAVVLVGPDVGRLWNLLIAHRAVAAPAARRLQARWVRGCLQLAKLVVVGSIAWTQFSWNYDYWTQRNDPTAVTPLTGVWEVTEYSASPANLFARDWSAPDAPTMTAADRTATPWRRMSFTGRNAVISFTDGRRRAFDCKLDALADRVTLSGRNAGAWLLGDFASAESSLPVDPANPPEYLRDIPEGAFAAPPPPSLRQLTLDGEFSGFDVHAVLRERPLSTFLIRGRGFHWIQEYPFNFNR